MPTIILETNISAPAQRCFDLSRSIELHTVSTSHTGERAVAGITKGLLGLNETVTWEAKHLGFRQRLTSSISAFDPPYYFVSEMVKGAFKKIYHQHFFEEKNQRTVMTDIFTFEAPLGWLGKLVSFIFLKNYMKNLLNERNEIIKRVAESDEWEKYIFEPEKK